MNEKTREFLNFLYWAADIAMRPTFRNLTDSYEAWAYRNGLLRELYRLERQQFIEQGYDFRGDRIYRLTEAGRLQALGGRDPETQWERAWDGRWRMGVFDVPVRRNSLRAKVRRYLRSRGFGYLQDSVWITPNPIDEERKAMAGSNIDVESLIWFEGRPCGGEPDEQIVAGAWDFERINGFYAEHLKTLDQRPQTLLRSVTAAKDLRRWAAAEQAAWLSAVSIDPLLPERLSPSEYLGQKAWRRRMEVFRIAGRQLRTFNL